jgi:putative heme iron utilization protein
MSNLTADPTIIKATIAQHPRLSAMDLQAKINASEVEIMAAMSDEVVEIPLAHRDEVLENLRGWGQVMSLIRNRDAVCELKFEAGTLYRHGEWLNSLDPIYNLHIRIAASQRILLLVKANHKRDGQTRSLNFANAAGELFWRVYAQTPAAQTRFEQLRQNYQPNDR